MPRNIELKTPFVFTESHRQRLSELGATHVSTLLQTDTYFHCRQGRLKLREIDESMVSGGDGSELASVLPAASSSRRLVELIAYHRPDTVGFRGSDYVVTPVLSSGTMLAALSASLGVKVVVRKTRQLWQWKNVRIHLDEVKKLGQFLEFEAVIDPSRPDSTQEASEQHLNELCHVLAIDPGRAIAGSYADMLTSARGGRVEPTAS